MNYSVSKDIQIVCKLLDISYSELSNYLGVARSTVSRFLKNEMKPSNMFLESFYSFAYSNPIRPIRLNSLKIQFALDNYNKVLFHGAKDVIEGEIDLDHSREDVDIGEGFYLGESFEQSSSYVFMNKKSSIYLFDVSKLAELKVKELNVSLEWMLLVSYYRGQLKDYSDSSLINELVNNLSNYDVIVAPIADNNMYEILSQFARGDITDKQAISALSASHLGKQHVLKTKKAVQSVQIVDRLYLCKEERNDIEAVKRENALIAEDKIKIAKEEYRRVGKYIEEILK